MRVLVLTPKFIWPLTGGAEIRNFNLLRETARHHEVYLLSFLFHAGDRDHFSSLQPYCRKIVGIDLERPLGRKLMHAAQSCLSSTPFILAEYHRPQMARAIEHLVAGESIDLIHAHFLHMGQYVSQKGRAAFVYDAHNLEHVLWNRFGGIQKNPLLRTFSRMQCGKLVAAQQSVASHSEKVVVLSDTDREEYLKIAPQADVVTVPNGADVEFFQPQAIDPEPHSLIYYGNFGWPPQDDAALYFHRDILPLIWQQCPQARLYLVGKTPPEAIRRLAGDNVIVTGFVPDIRESIARASVVVMPLRVGAGTKHRIFQALAMAKAVVTTTVGAEGMGLQNGETALVADDPQEFAAAALRLFADPALRVRLGENGRRYVVENFTWQANYDKLEAVFQGAIAKARRQPSPPSTP